VKVAILAPATSIHAIRWAEGLAAAGFEIVLATQHPPKQDLDPRVRLEVLPHRGTPGYFLNARPLRAILRRTTPDLVNAHYASGYGTLARLAGHRPMLLSVWGSDVFDFPGRSPLHRWWLRRTLRWADGIASTSKAMAQEVRRLVPEIAEVAITPFGVDTNLFRPRIAETIDPDPQRLVVGTVKTMAHVYGIDILIRAFAAAVSDPAMPPAMANATLLRLAGDGPELPAYRRLAARLGVEDKVEFIGSVPHASVPRVLQGLDVYAALSRRESFGVAVIEASACGVPAIVSDAGGLPEVVSPDETGLVVPREDVSAAATAIRRMLLDADLRSRLGKAGRRRVESLYAWDRSIETMAAVYAQMVEHR
jgi:L-malate glycosyltransferase